MPNRSVFNQNAEELELASKNKNGYILLWRYLLGSDCSVESVLGSKSRFMYVQNGHFILLPTSSWGVKLLISCAAICVYYGMHCIIFLSLKEDCRIHRSVDFSLYCRKICCVTNRSCGQTLYIIKTIHGLKFTVHLSNANLYWERLLELS